MTNLLMGTVAKNILIILMKSCRQICTVIFESEMFIF